MRLSSLPRDVLSLILDQVIANDCKRDGRKAIALNRESRSYNWEWADTTPRWVDLVALSQVNSTLWTLCKPTLWKSLSFRNLNNADLLYLIKAILPRYGLHIRSAVDLGLGFHGRSDTPRFICDAALGILPRSGNSPSSASNPVDIGLLGEPVLLPLRAPHNFDDESLCHDRMMVSQRTRLLATIFDRKSMPGLNRLEASVELIDLSAPEQLASLHATLGNDRLAALNVGLTDPEVESEDQMDANSLKPLYSALGQLITCQPNLELLYLWTQYGEDVFRRDAHSFVAKSIYGLARLGQLGLSRLPLRTPDLTKLCITPLTSLHLNSLEVSWEDLISFLNQHHATLRHLLMRFKNGPEPSTQVPVPPSQVERFSRLETLDLVGSLLPVVLTNFATAPLKTLSMIFNGAVGPTFREWLNLLEWFGGTLNYVYCYLDELVEGEKVAIEEEANARGICLEWR